MGWEVKIPMQTSPFGPLLGFLEQSRVLAKGVFGLFEARRRTDSRMSAVGCASLRGAGGWVGI